jgi:hypothetical protein
MRPDEVMMPQLALSIQATYLDCEPIIWTAPPSCGPLFLEWAAALLPRVDNCSQSQAKAPPPILKTNDHTRAAQSKRATKKARLAFEASLADCLQLKRCLLVSLWRDE